jgi:hypothetical protein
MSQFSFSISNRSSFRTGEEKALSGKTVEEAAAPRVVGWLLLRMSEQSPQYLRQPPARLSETQACWTNE